MKHTVTKTVTYRGCRLHARAVPQAPKGGFNAEVVVSTGHDGEHEHHAVQLRAWLHASADKALQYGLEAGRRWIEGRLVAGRGAN
jgi:hypothetical protein